MHVVVDIQTQSIRIRKYYHLVENTVDRKVKIVHTHLGVSFQIQIPKLYACIAANDFQICTL